MRRARHHIAAGLLLAAATAAQAEDVRHQVTDFQVTFYRNGGSADFQGWITLRNAGREVGFIYIANGQPRVPHLGSTRYVVIDIPVAMLGDTVALLSSGRPVFISYGDNGNPANASAFLDIGSELRPGDEAMADIRSTFRID